MRILKKHSAYPEDPVCGGILGKKVFCCVIDSQCKKFDSKDEILQFEKIYNLFDYHLEGDKCVVFFAKHADLIDPDNITVREGNANISIILSCNVEMLENSHIWYGFGVDYNASRKYIYISELAKNMELSRHCQEYMHLPETTKFQHF